ncbi:MAG TPA: FAD-dependent oxidoreductase [Gemmataceae bacterium]|jgi:monoamine oxidase
MSRSLFAQLHRRFAPAATDPDRRDVLRVGLAATTALLFGPPSEAFPKPEKDAKHILIIGAGFAGLACADRLKQLGYKVTVLEARRRLGGRVLTFKDLVPGKTVEGGGELIGPNQPAWNKYAERFKFKDRIVPAKEKSDDEAPIYLEGKRLTAAQARELWEEMDAAYKKILVDADDKKLDPLMPWMHPKAKELDARSTADWIASLKLGKPLVKKALETQIMTINGVLPEWQSYLANLAIIKGAGGEDFWIKTDSERLLGGNQQLADHLAEAIGRDHIHLGTPVTAVCVGEDKVTLTLADSKTLDGDDVVAAVPPSTWNRIAFDPPLPAKLAVQMSNSVKFLAAFKGRFWRDAKLLPESMMDGPINLTWENTFGQKGDKGACLTLYSSGNAADECLGWSAEQRAAKYLGALDLLYPGSARQFECGRFMNWVADTWSKGGPSFPAPGQVTQAGPILHDGLGRLHFAGEHTCYAFTGWMEGALESGLYLAQRLAKRDGKLKKEK